MRMRNGRKFCLILYSIGKSEIKFVMRAKAINSKLCRTNRNLRVL